MAWLLSWLVQGLAVALVARAAMRMLPRLSAATRYAIWWAAVLLVLLLPVMRSAVRADATTADRTASASQAIDTRGGMRATPAANVAPPSAAAPDATVGTVAVAASGGEPNSLRARVAASVAGRVALVPPLTLPRLPDWILAVAIGAWLGLAMLGLAQLAYSVSTVRRLKQSCRRLTVPRESQLPLWSTLRHRRRGVRVRTSDRLRTAAVLGLRRPIIAVPRDVSTTLTSAELDQVILHEYAHVRRFDDWGKLLQVAIGAFVGWHPAVRLMMREIDLEREAACDDWVVSVTGAPRAYARCLTKMAGFVPALGPAAAIPYAASTSHIARRIERLLAAPAVDARRGAARLAPLPALTAIAALVVVTFATVRAFPVAMDVNAIERDAARADASASGGATVANARADAGTAASGWLLASITRAGASAREAATSGWLPASATRADLSARGGAAVDDPRTGELRVTTAAMLPLSLSFSGLARLTGQPLVSETAAPSLPPAPASAAASTPAMVAMMEPAPADVPHAPARAADTHEARTTSPGHVERASHHDAFPLGPVVTAADSTSLAMVTDDEDNLDKTWGAVARDATTRAVGIGARSVGSATRTATSAAAANVKSATATAAGHVKSSSAKTARAIGRATRKVFSPF